jgi:membrane protease YdiL (CAAX protease family)
MDKLRRTARERPVVSFLLLSIVISWLLWGFQLMLPLIFPAPSGFISYLVLLTGFVPYLGPLIAAAALTWLTGGDLRSWVSQIGRWQVAPRWYGFALLLPLLCGVGVVVASAVFINAPWQIPFLAPLTSGRYVLVFATFVINGIGIEAGFRGFALPWLLQRFNALVASVILGVAWAVWSLPQLLFPASILSSFSIFMYVPALVIFSVLLTYIYNSTNGSVLAAAVLSGGIQTIVANRALEAPSLAMQFITLAIWAIPALTIANLYGEERLAERLPPTENIVNTLDG